MNNLALSFDEVAHLAATLPNNISLLVLGETGIGKSSLAKVVAQNLQAQTGQTYRVVYIDCTQAEAGDFVIPMPEMINGVQQLRGAPNAWFGIGSDTPIVLVLDELGKALKPTQNAALPLLLEHRIGDFLLPEGSRVIATSNLADEGLGDQFEAHMLNRVVCVDMRKPTTEEFLAYAMRTNLSAEVCAFVQQFPTCLQSWQDASAETNSYIHDPRRPERTAFVAPRSLERLSEIVAVRRNLPGNILLSAMVGTVGEAAARDMLTLLTLSDSLPTLESIFADPVKAKLPAQAVAQMLLGINLVRAADVATATAVLTYIQRMEAEITSVLAIDLVRNNNRMSVFALCPDFAKLAAKVSRYM